MEHSFFFRLVPELVALMGDAYPELVRQQSAIEQILLREEEQFRRTLAEGLRILESCLEVLEGQTVPADVIFKLYDTHGFPLDLTADIARERQLQLDIHGFDRLMSEQQARSRQAGQFANDYHDRPVSSADTCFIGYEALQEESQVLEFFIEGEAVSSIKAGQAAAIILDRTPFYAESGGQVGDVGLLENPTLKFEVSRTTRVGKAVLHQGLLLRGELAIGDRVMARVDDQIRQSIRLNHSATHLLHAALRQVLGSHVSQKGSLVTAERLRFDFSHFEPLSSEQWLEVESLVNAEIRANTPVTTQIMALEDAQAAGAMALFDEKYESSVRVLTMGRNRFSIELCGGTHAERTGDIGLFRILSESGIASGVRRIEAVTGQAALESVHESDQLIKQFETLLRVRRPQLSSKLEGLQDRVRSLEKELERQQAKLASASGDDLAGRALLVSDIKVLAEQIEGVEEKTLRELIDKLKNRLGSCIVVLAVVVAPDKIRIAGGVSQDLIARFKAGDLVNHVASQCGGKGGGRPDMAMAGASEPSQLSSALASVVDWVAGQHG
jgi:alanyl-tRNA synthetase